MLISTEQQLYQVGGSGIHQTGVFAQRFIPEGCRIIEYIGEHLGKDEAHQRAVDWEQEARETNQGLVYLFEVNGKYDIDGNVPWNDARFINHSCDPNAHSELANGRVWIMASRDIEAGEEITFDYGYDKEHYKNHPCLCGTEQCVGFIVKQEHHDWVREQVAKEG